MISRRSFLAFAGALAATPAALAQAQGKVWRVGAIMGTGRPPSIEASHYGGFTQGMRDLGLVEGKNLIIEWRFADGKVERYPDFVRELVSLKVDVIVAGNNVAALAAQQVTKAVPIVMGTSPDPVAVGLVQSLARPGGNITGLSQNLPELVPKSLELLKAVLPKLSRVAVLSNSASPGHALLLRNFQGAAAMMGLQLIPKAVASPGEIESAFAGLVREGAQAAVVLSDPVLFREPKLPVEAALKHKLPMLVQQSEHAEAGGLMSYGQSLRELLRRAATYVDKILKGAKPADLPVEQPNVYELVVNLKTARALGITIPRTVLMRADRTIE